MTDSSLAPLEPRPTRLYRSWPPPAGFVALSALLIAALIAVARAPLADTTQRDALLLVDGLALVVLGAVAALAWSKRVTVTDRSLKVRGNTTRSKTSTCSG